MLSSLDLTLLFSVPMLTSSNGNISLVSGPLCGIHRSPVPSQGQWRGILMFSLICAWINGWVNNRDAGDLRRHRAHHDVTVMLFSVSKRRHVGSLSLGHHWSLMTDHKNMHLLRCRAYGHTFCLYHSPVYFIEACAQIKRPRKIMTAIWKWHN